MTKSFKKVNEMYIKTFEEIVLTIKLASLQAYLLTNF